MIAVGAALLASAPVAWTPLAAQPRGVRTIASARLTLDHRAQDQLTWTMAHLEAELTLEQGPGDAVALRLLGTSRSHDATLTPPDRAEATDPSERAVDERWTGHLRRDGEDLVLRFDHSSAFGPVDLEWRCVPDPADVAGRRVVTWRCATPQAQTRPSGAAHHLPIYLQIPLRLAAPAEHLAVEASAHGGADHRSTLDGERLSRTGPASTRPSSGAVEQLQGIVR